MEVREPSAKYLARPGFKQTEAGVIPEDWDAVPLTKITADIGDGIHTTPVYSSNGNYYFINGNNLRDGKIVVTEETKTVAHSEFTKYRKNLSDRSILMSINGTIGTAHMKSLGARPSWPHRAHLAGWKPAFRQGMMQELLTGKIRLV